MADLVGPGALSQTPLSEGTTFLTESAPAASVSHTWNAKNELQKVLKFKLIIVYII